MAVDLLNVKGLQALDQQAPVVTTEASYIKFKTGS
jgi:hypothetical protein